MLSRLFMIQPSKILIDVDLYLNHASPLSSYIEMSNKKNTDRHLFPVGQTTFVHPTLSTVSLPYLSLLMCQMLLRPSELA